MWSAVEMVSYPLIISSTIGFITACVILLLYLNPGLTKSFFPRTNHILQLLLFVTNLLAGITTLTSVQPNLGTMTFPLGLLPYAGILTTIAAPVNLLNRFPVIQKRLIMIVILVLTGILFSSLGWIIRVWLTPLLDYYQPALTIILFVLGGSTLGLGTCMTRWNKSTKAYPFVASAFSFLLVFEATTVFFLANLLLLMFVGLVLNA